MQEKRIYYIKKDKNSSVSKRLEWTQNLLSNISQYNRENNYKTFNIGEIYRCQYFSQETGNVVVQKAIVIKQSLKEERFVYICPIIEKIDDLYQSGIHIGFIPTLSLEHTFIAKINLIQAIPKEAFVLEEGQQMTNLKPVGYLDKDKYLRIITAYRDILTKFIDSNSIIFEAKSKTQNIFAC